MVTRPDAGLGRDTVTGEPRQATQQQQPGLCGLVVQLQMNIRTMLQNCEIVSARCSTVALFGKHFPPIKNNSVETCKFS